MHDLIQWLNIHPLFWPLFIFSARVVDVSLGTLRTICVIRGMRLVASVLGGPLLGLVHALGLSRAPALALPSPTEDGDHPGV